MIQPSDILRLIQKYILNLFLNNIYNNCYQIKNGKLTWVTDSRQGKCTFESHEKCYQNLNWNQKIEAVNNSLDITDSHSYIHSLHMVDSHSHIHKDIHSNRNLSQNWVPEWETEIRPAITFSLNFKEKPTKKKSKKEFQQGILRSFSKYAWMYITLVITLFIISILVKFILLSFKKWYEFKELKFFKEVLKGDRWRDFNQNSYLLLISLLS